MSVPELAVEAKPQACPRLQWCLCEGPYAGTVWCVQSGQGAISAFAVATGLVCHIARNGHGYCLRVNARATEAAMPASPKLDGREFDESEVTDAVSRSRKLPVRRGFV